MNQSIKLPGTVLAFIFSATILLTGCNNPVNSEEKHPHPQGAVFKMNGEEIVRYENGASSGSFDVNKGNETPLITIYFLDEKGQEFQPDEAGSSLKWKDINTSIAEIEQHSEDGKWSFHIIGLAQGSTTVTFQLYHDGHSDFDITGIPVNVN